MEMPETLEEKKPRTIRIIDFQIPLVWLLSCAGGLAFCVISMWFTLQQLVRDVGDVQIAVKSGNTQVVTLAGELAILRWRVDAIEGGDRVSRAAKLPPPPAASGGR